MRKKALKVATRSASRPARVVGRRHRRVRPGRRADPVAMVTDLGHATNLLWVDHRRRAGDLHAGRLRARRDRLLPGQACRPRRQHELRHLRPRVRRLLLHRLPARLRRLRAPALLRARRRRSAERCSAAATGSSSGRAAGPCPAAAITPAVARLLPLHGRLHGHHGHHPDRLDGRAVEVEQLRRLGPLLRRDLLPAVRGVDLGRRLARQDLGHHEPRRRLRRLRRLRCRPRRRRCRGPRRCARARPPHRQVRPGRQAPRRCPATTSRWPCSACFILLFGWFGFNAASTFAATDIQFAVVADEHRDRRRRSAPSSPCSG